MKAVAGLWLLAYGHRKSGPCFVRSRTTMPVINTQAANSSPGDVVREMLKERSADAVSHRSRAIVAVLAFPLFLDYFLYGLLFTLPAHSHAGVGGEGHVALLYGVYAISVLLVTPLFGYLGDRFGSRSTMICGAALAVVAVSLFGMAPASCFWCWGRFARVLPRPRFGPRAWLLSQRITLKNE
jgi:predicted MFS family arabinose efflux permease